MSEKIPEPYGWVHDWYPDDLRFRREPLDGIIAQQCCSIPVYSHEQMNAVQTEISELRLIVEQLTHRNPYLVVRLTDEQIEVIEMDQWNHASVTRDGFDCEAFARAIETAVLKANGLEGQQ